MLIFTAQLFAVQCGSAVKVRWYRFLLWYVRLSFLIVIEKKLLKSVNRNQKYWRIKVEQFFFFWGGDTWYIH